MTTSSHMAPAAKPGTAITLKNCAKTFADGTRALMPFDLSITAGETLVLLGPSGCGKTTILRMIAGLEFPDAGGKIHFGDDDVTRQSIEARRVGMVFQSYALFPNMTVAENVAYGLKVQKVAKAERDQRVHEMLEMMHIDMLADRRVDQLSGGQRQRVALARAIAPRPRVLLLDEPLTALDAKLRVRLRTEINALLRKLGITAIYVTHDQEEAMALGDRIVVMQKGEVAQIGTPQDIYRAPKTPFVADFVGASNCLKVDIAGGRALLGQVDVDVSSAWNASQATDGISEIYFRADGLALCGADDAHFSATVEAVSYLGDRMRVTVTGIGDGAVLVDTSPDIIMTPGERVHCRLVPERLTVFAAGAGQ
ncbi:ABC transporter ATP-binding protein [Thalassospira sp. MA62]|nr:ABC transporter ATP-binding protein [Thalassospira sp. MA62]